MGLLAFGWDNYFQKIFKEGSDSLNAANNVVNTITTVLWIAIGIVGLCAVVYAIYLGINLARAADQSKRDEARKHLITVIIAIVVTLVLVFFFLYLLPEILAAFKTNSAPETPAANIISTLKLYI